MKQCNKNLLDYDLARRSLEHLTVARAVHYLTYIFDCGTHEIYAPSKLGKVNVYTTTTPVTLATTPQLAGRLASCVKVCFWGGPPGSVDWYYGSMLTLLMDKLFYCVIRDYTDVVDKFLETLNDAQAYSHGEN